jgi:hypothetical protein
MSNYLTYRPSKRPSVKQVSNWDNLYENSAIDWCNRSISVKVENGYPFPDFYRVTYTIDGMKKSQLFYGETAWNDTERFVYDLGFRDVLGML